MKKLSTKLCPTCGISSKFGGKGWFIWNSKRYEYQNTLVNKDFDTFQRPELSSPINHKTKNIDFQDNRISNDFDEIENKNSFPGKIFPKHSNKL